MTDLISFTQNAFRSLSERGRCGRLGRSPFGTRRAYGGKRGV